MPGQASTLKHRLAAWALGRPRKTL